MRWHLQTDVSAFRQAIKNTAWAEALRLYTGSLLADFHSNDSPEFMAWLLAERQALFSLWRGALLAQVNHLVQTNQAKDGLGLLETLFLADPLDEEALLIYMSITPLAGQE